MDTMILGFRRTDVNDTAFTSKLIAAWTNGPYSHVAIILKVNGEYVSYEAKEGRGKVVKNEHILNDINASRYDYVHVPINNQDVIVEFLESIVDQKYDYAGIIGFVLPFKDRSDMWFCSEVASNVLKIDGYKPMWYLEPSSVSPNLLFNLVSIYKDPNVKYAEYKPLINLRKLPWN